MPRSHPVLSFPFNIFNFLDLSKFRFYTLGEGWAVEYG